MEIYVGLDISLEETSICVAPPLRLDQLGRKLPSADRVHSVHVLTTVDRERRSRDEISFVVD